MIGIGFQYLRVQIVLAFAFFQRVVIPIAVGGLAGALRLRHTSARSSTYVVFHDTKCDISLRVTDVLQAIQVCIDPLKFHVQISDINLV